MPAKVAPFIRFGQNYEIDPITGCWNWTGKIGSSGYGEIKVFGKMEGAHRLSHMLYNGHIHLDNEVKHSCDNKKCVNPDHLSQGTHASNMGEAADRKLMPSGDDHWMRKNGNPNKGAKSKQSIPVVVLGVPYGSLKEAEKALNLGSGSVAYWIRTKNPKARVITREDYYNWPA